MAGLVVYSSFRQFRAAPAGRVGPLGIAGYRAQPIEESRPAPGFEMPSLGEDGTIALQDFAGKVVVLNFWASWCGPCRAEAPTLQRLWEEYGHRGVQFLGVNYRDDEFAAREYEREFRITYPSVFDPAGELAFEYQLIGLPATFVIDSRGRVVYRFTGIVTEPLLRDAIQVALRRGMP